MLRYLHTSRCTQKYKYGGRTFFIQVPAGGVRPAAKLLSASESGRGRRSNVKPLVTQLDMSDSARAVICQGAGSNLTTSRLLCYEPGITVIRPILIIIYGLDD
jgi:hypothetical protein